MVLDIVVGSRGPRLHLSSAPEDQEIHCSREGTWRTDQFGKARSHSQFSGIQFVHSLGRILKTGMKGCSARNRSAKLSRALLPTDTGLESGYSTLLDNSETTHTS